MSNTSACFFPNGKSDGANLGQNFVPCDPSAAQSACCSKGETCVGAGLCLSDGGLLYRGACTDKTYEDGACPNVCTDMIGTGKNSGRDFTFEFVVPCAVAAPQNPSGWTNKWVCGLGTDCKNASMLFNLEPGAPKQLKITGNLSPSSSTVSNSNASSTLSPTPPNTPSAVSSSSAATSTQIQAENCSSKVTAVGAGVGIPFALLAISALIFAIWQWRKGKAQQRKFNHDLRVLEQNPGYEEVPRQSLSTSQNPQSDQELDGRKAKDTVFELKSTRPVVELA